MYDQVVQPIVTKKVPLGSSHRAASFLLRRMAILATHQMISKSYNMIVSQNMYVLQHRFMQEVQTK
jgi:hypothetical protein